MKSTPRPRQDAGLTDVMTLAVDTDGVLASPLFPGLRIALRDVFRCR